MTTPERLRRRQRIEGSLLVLIGLLVLLQSLWFNTEDRQQRRCLEENFSDLSVALEARAKLTQQDTESTRRVILAASTAHSRGKLRAALDRYVREQTAIQQERRAHPLPPYPPGTCQSKR